jgi:6-phosphofructokinase 1
VETSPDPIRLGGIATKLADDIEDATGLETRATILGHVQRGGAPTPFDRVLGTRFGVAAAQLVQQGRFGRMVALQGNECTSVPIADVAGRNRLVPPDHELWRAALALGVSLGESPG